MNELQRNIPRFLRHIKNSCTAVLYSLVVFEVTPRNLKWVAWTMRRRGLRGRGIGRNSGADIPAPGVRKVPPTDRPQRHWIQVPAQQETCHPPESSIQYTRTATAFRDYRGSDHAIQHMEKTNTPKFTTTNYAAQVFKKTRLILAH